MKRTFYFIGVFIFSFLLFTSCESDDDESYVSDVTNVQVTPGIAGLIVSWDLPGGEEVDHVSIEYTDAYGVDFKKKVNSVITKDTIAGLAEVKEYELTLKLYNLAGDVSKGVSIVGTPQQSAQEAVAASIDLEVGAGLEFVTVSWLNNTGEDVTVNVTYMLDGKLFVFKKTSAVAEGTFVVDNLPVGNLIFTVFVTDGDSFQSSAKTFAVAPEPGSIIKLAKTTWSVIDFSSEEPGEGAPNGLATAIMDNDLGTFWHSEWAQDENDIFPHHIILDLGAEITIDHFETYRRQGDNRGHVECQYFISSDNENWTDLGTFEVDNESDDAQVQKPAEQVTARYVKFVATKGSYHADWDETMTFTFMAELDIFYVYE
jgi:hypothetical protein